MLKALLLDINKRRDPVKAKLLQRFFKTGKGEYGEGDVFLGIVVPVQRMLAKKYSDSLTFDDLDKLLKSKIHEHRLIALLVLVDKFQKTPTTSSRSNRDTPPWKGGEAPRLSSDTLPRRLQVGAPKPTLTVGSPIPNKGVGAEASEQYSPPDKGQTRAGGVPDVKSGEVVNQKQIYDFYLRHAKFINNWDLVDLSAPKIVGSYLFGKNKSILYKLARSKNLWERRIAVLSTFYDVYKGKPGETLKIAKLLLTEKHDLIHKAVGWMLREAGKRCGEKYLLQFLDAHHTQMPRTMLRYAIERLPKYKRNHYMK